MGAGGRCADGCCFFAFHAFSSGAQIEGERSQPGVTIAALTAIGDLARVSETEMRLWSPELLPLLLDMLADASLPAKRENVLWTLAQLIESTG